LGIKPIQVDESEKDDPEVQATTVPVVVGGNTVNVTTYMRLELFDDLEPVVTVDVLPVELHVPVRTEEEYETGETNEDGSAKLAVRPAVKYVRRVVDLGTDSFERLQEALKPFLDVSRTMEIPEQPKKRGRPRKTAQTAPSGE
jgi:hypothetical protein